MSNLDNPLFESVCALLGIDKKAVEEYLKDSMSNTTCDVEQKAPVESPAVDHDDLPNRMNPGGKSDNQLKAEGWKLSEDFEKREDGAYVCKRVWTKSEETSKCNCEKGTRDNLGAQLKSDISDTQLKSDMLTVDHWMDTLNWALLDNWVCMKNAMLTKLPGAENEIESILKFVNFILQEPTQDNTTSVLNLWNTFPSKNAYSTAEILDHVIQDIIESVKENELDSVARMNNLCPEARNVFIKRLSNYKKFLEEELEIVTDSIDYIEPEYHHTNIVTPYFESSLYSMIYLWYSLITEYLAELIEITNKILSANKVL